MSSHRNLAAFGLTDGDWEVVTGADPWLSGDRHIARRAVEALVFGSMDAVGIARFEPPAEYIAAVIAFFVAPVNLIAAASYMSGKMPTSDTLHTQADYDNIDPSHLLSLISQVSSQDLEKFRRRFEESVGKKMARDEFPSVVAPAPLAND